jgi:hypothetical protein
LFKTLQGTGEKRITTIIKGMQQYLTSISCLFWSQQTLQLWTRFWELKTQQITNISDSSSLLVADRFT